MGPQLKELLARELSCGDRTLASDEISVRLIPTVDCGSIAPIEIEITAHAYGERIPRVDRICLTVKTFIRKQISEGHDVQVWLILTELGHSWDE
jgi:hypothetical protein